MESSTTSTENVQTPSPELVKRLLDAYEKKKMYDKEYMNKKRMQNRDEVNRYKRELYRKKKEALKGQ